MLFMYDYEQTLNLMWSYIFIYNLSLLPIFAVLLQLNISNVKTINFLNTLGFNYTLTKFLMISFLSAAGIPPFLGFFSKIFIFILLCNTYLSVFFIIFIILLFTGLYFYMQNIRFLNTSNLQNMGNVFEKNIRVVPSFYYFCFPNMFMLIFGFTFLDDCFLFFRWCFN